MMVATRGTTNGNVRGNAEDRRRRRVYLVTTYQADQDARHVYGTFPTDPTVTVGVALGEGIPACRCYRCGVLLTVETVTVDRIIPGCRGGTYRRSNIRPACAACKLGNWWSAHPSERVEEMSDHYYAAPLPVAECPNSHEGPISVVGYKVTGREEIEIGPRVFGRNVAELVGWHLSCGCFVSGKRFTLLFVPPDLPLFTPNER